MERKPHQEVKSKIDQRAAVIPKMPLAEKSREQWRATADDSGLRDQQKLTDTNMVKVSGHSSLTYSIMQK